MFSFSMKFDKSKLEKLDAEVTKKLVKVVKKHAMNIQAVAAVNAPVDTGALMNSIQARQSDNTDKNWIIDDGVTYGVFQELGTSKGVPALHFLGGACEKEADKFFDDIRGALG